MNPIILPRLPQPMKLIRSTRCENCKWAEPEGPASKNFMCHRNPPAVGFVEDPRPPKGRPLPVSSFAIVLPDQWCGEHQPKIGGGVVDAAVVAEVAAE